MTDFAAARTAMVDCQVRPSDVTRYPIIEAMLTLPREDFVPSSMREVAYAGADVPLGEGRYLLDPRVMGKMLDAAAITGDDLVLDLGCGMGYSSALIGWMAGTVVAVEPVAALAEEAAQLLVDNDAMNVLVETGPLAEGSPTHGPYDAIMVQGAIEALPDAIADQLKDGGRIVAIKVVDGASQCQIGTKLPNGISWRRVFDATAPMLDGFTREKSFEF